jgi:hypothetical protein
VIYKTIIRPNRKEKKNIFKAVKKTKIQNKILAAAATASATSSILSEEEDCESNSSESNYDDTFAVTPARNPNDDTEPMDCTEKGSSDYNIIFKLIFLCFLFFYFQLPRIPVTCRVQDGWRFGHRMWKKSMKTSSKV